MMINLKRKDRKSRKEHKGEKKGKTAIIKDYRYSL